MQRPAMWLVMAVVFLAVQPEYVQAQAGTRTGVLTVAWGDPQPGSGGVPELAWVLTDDAGVEHFVDMPRSVLDAAGGVLAIDRRRVRLQVADSRVAPFSPGGEVVLEAGHVQVEGAAASATVLGSRPYAVLLCRFADIATEPQPPAFFAQLMGDGFPNMNHYFAEASNGQVSLAGTQVFGWFPLPNPHAYYASMSSTAMLSAVAQDCTAAADPWVNFANFSGIAIQVNAQLAATGAGSAWGGSRLMTLDGVRRAWPMVWMPLWATQGSRFGVWAHELGHSFGLPHSSGPYDAIYDSKWDVMSSAYLHWNGSAWIPGGTISYHKTLLGWIPAARTATISAASATVHEISLEQSVFPTAGAGVQAVRINIPGTLDFYTVEARRRLGYDTRLPGEAVIIHRVPNPAGPNCTGSRCARVVDADNNGDPNDAGAMWMPGETFDDGLGIRVSVLGRTAEGWDIAVTPGNILTVRGAGNSGGTVRTQAGASPGVNCALSAGAATGTCAAAYYGNPTVTLTAQPATGATFHGWSGGCEGTTSCTLLMTQAREVTARFSSGTCTLALAAAPQQGGVLTGAGSYPCDTEVLAAAAPAAGFAFTGWFEADSLVSGSPSLALALDRDRTLQARFVPAVSVLTSSSPAEGGTTAGGGTFPAGTVVTVSATAAADHAFVHWTEGSTIVAGSASWTFTPTGNVALVAQFAPLRTLTVRGSGAGTGQVTSQPAAIKCVLSAAVPTGTGDCHGRFAHGTVVSLAPAPYAGQRFTGWSGACSGTGPCEVRLTDVATVTATFEPLQYDIAATVEPAHAGAVTGTGSFAHGSPVTLTAAPSAGYEFTGWSEDGVVVASTASYTFTATGARTLVAGFRQRTRTLSIEATGGGSGQVVSEPAGIACTLGAAPVGPCSTGFPDGAAVRLTFTGTAGTHLAAWTGCTAVGAACDVVMSEARVVRLHALARPASLTTARAADALLHRVTLTDAEILYLDAIGNGNGRFDLGDFLAWLARQ